MRPSWFSSPLYATVRNITVILGAHDIYEPEQSQQVRGVLKYYPHPAYNPNTVANDIMLLKARRPRGAERGWGQWGQTARCTQGCFYQPPQPCPPPGAVGPLGRAEITHRICSAVHPTGLPLCPPPTLLTVLLFPS